MRYIYNEEKKTVVAIIEDCSEDLINYIERKTGIYVSGKKFLLNNKYVGKAKCSDNDEFDYEYGKILAARRASLKYEKDRNRKMMIFAKDILTNVKDCADAQNHRLDLAETRLSEIETNKV